MKSLIALALLLVSSVSAQIQKPVLTAAGPWPLCVDAATAIPALCSQYVPGREAYLLLIPPSRRAVSFRYRVSGTLSDGTEVIQSGSVDRAGNSIDPEWTSTVLSFGGVISHVRITIEELAVVGVRTTE